jgi:quaternary ammonium compound-resistance protein SugE
MNWIFLFAAGVMEIGWVFSLKFSHGFTKLVPTIFYAVFGFTGALLFSNALKTLPASLAYAIWAGIAVIGTAVAEIFLLNRPLSSVKIFFILLIITGIIGLKLSAQNILK